MSKESKAPVKVTVPVKMTLGVPWFGLWLFTIAFAHLGFGRGLLAIVLWPYYLGDAIATVVSDEDRALIAAASAPVVTALVTRIGELHHALLRAAGVIDGMLPVVSARDVANELYAIAAKGTVLP